MILIDLTYSVTTVHISDEPRSGVQSLPFNMLDYEQLPAGDVYHPYLVGLDELRVATPHPWGGFARAEYGTIKLANGVWNHMGLRIPPTVIGVTVYYVPDIWSGATVTAQIILEGSAVLQGYSSGESTYQVYHGTNSQWSQIEVEQGVEFKGLISDVFDGVASDLSVTVDTSLVRATNEPTVDYTTTSKRLLVDVLSDIAAACTHRFTIRWTSDAYWQLKLMDVWSNNGTRALTVDDVTPMIDYRVLPPANWYIADYRPAYVWGVKLRFLNRSDGAASGIMAMAEADVYAFQGQAVPFTPNVLADGITQSGYPASNLTDNNAATDWRGTLPDLQLRLWRAPGYCIAEYELKASAAGGAYAPGKWEVWGYDEARDNYYYMATVESKGWSTGEARRFQVDVQGINWPVRLAGSYYYGETLNISPICHTAYGNILGSLSNIKALYDRTRIRLQLPMGETLPKIGEQITLHNTVAYGGITSTMRVAEIVYDCNSQTVVVEGDGELS
ncbi:MAG: hypothetical protein RBR26_15285 [Methanosarcina mazei]|nr:hypothetical protein [Methanosarcina mazei]